MNCRNLWEGIAVSMSPTSREEKVRMRAGIKRA